MVWEFIRLLKTIIMLKSILKLDGAQILTKNKQKSINGGLVCNNDACIIKNGLSTCYRTKCNGIVYDAYCCS
jgi:hypothetical protein